MSKIVNRIKYIVVLLTVLPLIYLGCNLNEKDNKYPYVPYGIFENIAGSLPDSLFNIVVKRYAVLIPLRLNFIYFTNDGLTKKDYFSSRELYYYNTIQYSDSLYSYALLIKEFPTGDRAIMIKWKKNYYLSIFDDTATVYTNINLEDIKKINCNFRGNLIKERPSSIFINVKNSIVPCFFNIEDGK